MLDWVKRGLVAGFTGAATIAAGVFLYDLIVSEPLATPDALARNLLGAPVVPVEGTEAAVAGGTGTLAWIADAGVGAYRLALYTLVHFAAFLLLGLSGAWLFLRAGVPGNVLTGALFGAGIGTAVFYAGFALLAPGSVHLPAVGLVVAMNAVAGVVMVSQIVDAPDPA